MDKKFYLAPMEGITGYIFRNAYNKYYGDVDYYVTPFISPTQNKILSHRELEDILPEHNAGINVIPQILSNNADLFIETAKQLADYGYKEVNLNLGCPSGTVVSKFKGAGFLADLDRLDDFLNRIFEVVNGQMGMDISIKTRIGRDEPEEFHSLLIIFNQYPIKLLTVHPRVQKEFYKGKCHLEIFEEAVKESENPLCYNGDINTIADYEKISERFPNVDNFMIGRGILRNPNLVGSIKSDLISKTDLSKVNLNETKINGLSLNKFELNDFDKKKLRSFHDELYAGYEEIFSGDRNVLFKMKELWFYLGDSFSGCEKMLKQIKKATKKESYYAAINAIFN